MKDKILEVYEQMAEAYNDRIDTKAHNAYYDRPNTLSLFPAQVEGIKILDAACGPGKYAEILLESGATVIGCDISPKMIDLARQRNGSRGSFFVHDLENPFHQLPDESFDIILSALALDYLPDWSPTLDEFYRLLQPSGHLIFSIEHPFFKYQYHGSDNYFETEGVHASWTGFGGTYQMPSYRRSLQSVLIPILHAGFRLDHILEPRPTAEFEKSDPKHFKELNQFPAFLCIRAVKE
jgi:SAM-dependent methyltransferase